MPYDQMQYAAYGGYQQGGNYTPQQQYWPQQQGGYPPYPQQQGYPPQQQWPPDAYGYPAQAAGDAYGNQWQQQGYYPQEQEIFDPYGPEEELMLPEVPEGKKKKKHKELPPKVQKPLHFILQAVYWVFLVALVAGSVLFASSKDPRKDIFGFRSYNVLTQSMTPTLQEDGTMSPEGLGPLGGFDPGDTIIIKMDPAEQVKAGDIITFNPNSRDSEGTNYLTHRVIKVLTEMNGEEGLWFVTKGDHNNSEDPPITSSMYIGRKVFHIPKIGKLLGYVKKNPILALLMFVSFFGCIFMLRWYFAKPQPEQQKKKKGKAAADPPEPEPQPECSPELPPGYQPGPPMAPPGHYAPNSWT